MTAFECHLQSRASPTQLFIMHLWSPPRQRCHPCSGKRREATLRDRRSSMTINGQIGAGKTARCWHLLVRKRSAGETVSLQLERIMPKQETYNILGPFNHPYLNRKRTHINVIQQYLSVIHTDVKLQISDSVDGFQHVSFQSEAEDSPAGHSHPG